MGQTTTQVNTDHQAGPNQPVTFTESASLIYDREGNRKYLTRSERTAFLLATKKVTPEVRTFCLTLAYTGARVSEVLALTPSRVDPIAGVVVFESLKKRRRGVFRAVPLPPDLLDELEVVHEVTRRRATAEHSRELMWPWGRTAAWMRVKACMGTAAVIGPQASPKGLRHAFAVAALQAGIPINFVRKWLGHARLSTTEIYADAVGPEEQAIARRFWKTF